MVFRWFFVSLGIVAANSSALVLALIAWIAIATLVVLKEESELERKSGVEYQAHIGHTGRFAPAPAPLQIRA